MAVAADGIISKPVDYLRKTVAASSTFRTWVGASDAADALNYIHVRRVAESAISRPLAVVEWADNFELEQVAGGDRNHYEVRGDLFLLFEAEVSSSHDEADAFNTFANNVGDILDEMWQVAGTAGYLNITRMTTERTIMRASEDEAATVDSGDFYQVIYRVEFGG